MKRITIQLVVLAYIFAGSFNAQARAHFQKPQETNITIRQKEIELSVKRSLWLGRGINLATVAGFVYVTGLIPFLGRQYSEVRARLSGAPRQAHQGEGHQVGDAALVAEAGDQEVTLEVLGARIPKNLGPRLDAIEERLPSNRMFSKSSVGSAVSYVGLGFLASVYSQRIEKWLERTLDPTRAFDSALAFVRFNTELSKRASIIRDYAEKISQTKDETQREYYKDCFVTMVNAMISDLERLLGYMRYRSIEAQCEDPEVAQLMGRVIINLIEIFIPRTFAELEENLEGTPPPGLISGIVIRFFEDLNLEIKKFTFLEREV